jgi:hypothetical protein
MFRSVNERVEEVVHPEPNEEIDFLCECGDDRCVEEVTLTRLEYERVRADGAQFVVTPGHEIPRIENVVMQGERFLVVRKHPDEAEIAHEMDPRCLATGRPATHGRADEGDSRQSSRGRTPTPVTSSLDPKRNHARSGVGCLKGLGGFGT